jgi:hypothetical protein
MSEKWQSRTTHRTRRFILYVALLLLAFLLGFVPMWWLNSQCSSSLAEAERRQAWPGWRIALPPQPSKRSGEIMKQRVKLTVAFLPLYRQKRTRALIRPSHRQKSQVYSRW